MKLAWSHPIATRAALRGPRTTYAEAAKYVRNQLRPYSVESVALLALDLLQRGEPQSHEHLKTWPWITCLVVKLACEDSSTPLRGAACPPRVFDRCRQALWDAQAGKDRFDDARGSLYLMLRSMLRAQLAFQSKPSWDFLRFPALVRRLPEDHATRQMFDQQFGMDPKTFICLCYVITVTVLAGDRIIHLSHLDKLTKAFGAAVERFFALFARDLPGLRQELQQELQFRLTEGLDRRPYSEYNDFPWLSKFPLLQRSAHDFVVWHPLVFARGIEDAVHRRLSMRRDEYASQFSKVFEDYVLEVLRASGKSYLSEEAYKSRYGRDKKAVEAIIMESGINIFVESKMTAYSADVVTSGRAPVVWKGLKRVREAMDQGWTVSTALRSNAFADLPCATAQEDFFIVVTSQQMMCATGEHFRRLFKPDVFEPAAQTQRGTRLTTPDTQQLTRLPLKNIVVASISEFEHLMGAVAAGALDLVTFLREVAQANEDPHRSVMFLEQMLAEHIACVKPPQALTEAWDEAETTLISLLGGE